MNRRKTEETRDSHCYDDILSLPHPTSKKHRRMSGTERAAQFSPFAALSGYEAAVEETARLTEGRTELEEDEKARLDMKMQFVREHLGEEIEVFVTCFVPDERKEGGSYCTLAGRVQKLNDLERWILLSEGSRILMDDIVDLEITADSLRRY